MNSVLLVTERFKGIKGEIERVMEEMWKHPLWE